MKESNQKTLLSLITLGALVVVALVLGLVLGLKIKEDKKQEITQKVEIVNNYDNTDELLKDINITYNTTINPGKEERIQNRLITGFKNWNLGFQAWKEWGNILYTNESIYNVHGARLNLAHYQAAMDVSLQQSNITMGNFYNMLIIDDFAAIHYDFKTSENPNGSHVMEFVHFGDNSNETFKNTVVIEGWGSTRDDSYYGLINFQGPDEKREQEELNNFLLTYNYRENESYLTKKYFVKYPTNNTGDNVNEILDIILEGFDRWNNDTYGEWVDKYYLNDSNISALNETNRNLDQYKTDIKNLFENEKITKLYFDNILIRDNWAALHYRYRREDRKNTKTKIGDRMEFLQFKIRDDKIKIANSWIQ